MLITQAARLPDRYLVVGVGPTVVGRWEITQAEYEALALEGAGPPPRQPGFSAREWRAAWETGELVAAGGVVTLDTPSSKLEAGLFYVRSDQVFAQFEHQGILYQMALPAAHLAAGNINYVGQGVTIVNNDLAVTGPLPRME